MIADQDAEKEVSSTEWAGLIAFLRALCFINERGKVQAPDVHVKYAQDEEIYLHWTPGRQSDIEANGLRDPGFGPGPVYYADLDLAEVRLSDWVAQKGGRGIRPELYQSAELILTMASCGATLDFDPYVHWPTSSRRAM
ncbi:hypothetical protein [Stenotrophomonas sp. PD6]|uniref:hypothetical protein n=1 Tax=Stenotrophomonas sp. PD6 TaxID=3368612 RepID=UPI003B9E797F